MEPIYSKQRPRKQSFITEHRFLSLKLLRLITVDRDKKPLERSIVYQEMFLMVYFFRRCSADR